ncbi:MAG: TIGR04552 family protein, partial [Candidatus Sericytochromatia bacterium]
MNLNDQVAGVPINDPVYHFPWQVLDAIIAGRSAIDLRGLRLSTPREAHDFLAAYGFDWDDPYDSAEMDEVYRQTARFIEDVLLPHEGLTRLLLVASTSDHPLRDWACSFLRVSHAVVHARYSQNHVVLAEARRQVFDRFSAHLKVSQNGMLVSDGEMHVPLLRCDFKPEKPWESLVLKLLHKVDNVAQEVYDHLGVRFVTPDKAYALLLLKYFRHHNVFAFANVKPSRSVNTLVDVKDFRAHFEELEEAYHHGEMTFKEFTRGVHLLGKTPDASHDRNPHSASQYQTIQFTARALVRLPYGSTVTRTFVPFEVQIMDEAAYHDAQQGEASHQAYRT